MIRTPIAANPDITSGHVYQFHHPGKRSKNPRQTYHSVKNLPLT
jgi:hypothetical protein